jgi:hypothetical protein
LRFRRAGSGTRDMIMTKNNAPMAGHSNRLPEEYAKQT